MSLSNQNCAEHRGAKEKKATPNGQNSHSQCRYGQYRGGLTDSFIPEVFSNSQDDEDELVTTDVFGNDIFGLEVSKSGEFNFDTQIDEENEIEESIYEQLARLPFENEESCTDSSPMPDLEFSKSSVSSSQGENNKLLVRSCIDFQYDQVQPAENKLHVRSCGDFQDDHVPPDHVPPASPRENTPGQATRPVEDNRLLVRSCGDFQYDEVQPAENKLYVRSCGDFQYDHVPPASPRGVTSGQSTRPAHSKNHKRHGKSRNGHVDRRTKSSDYEFCSLARFEDKQRVQSGTLSSHRRCPRQTTRGADRRTKSVDLDDFFDKKSPRSKSKSLSRKLSSRRNVGAKGSKTGEQSGVPESNTSSKHENFTKSSRTKSPTNSRHHRSQSADFHQQGKIVLSPKKSKHQQRSRTGDAWEYQSPSDKASSPRHQQRSKTGDAWEYQSPSDKASSQRTRRRATLQTGHDPSPESSKRSSLQRARSEEKLESLGMYSPVRQQSRSKTLEQFVAPPPLTPALVQLKPRKRSISPRKSPNRIGEKSPKANKERMRLPRVQPEDTEKLRNSPKRDYNRSLSRTQLINSLTRSQSVTLRPQRTGKRILDKISSERQLEIFMDVNNRSWTAQVPVLEHFDKPAPGPWQARKEASNRRIL